MLFTATLAVVLLLIWILNAYGFRSPITAFLINWLAMSWIAVTGQLVRFSFPKGYYEIKSFERTGQIYERLGIRLFKKIVRRGPLSIFSPTLRFPKERTITALLALDAEMRKAETGHAIIFGLVLIVCCYALSRGWYDAFGWLLLFNLLINGYPILLQRFNRIKLQELIRSIPPLSETAGEDSL